MGLYWLQHADLRVLISRDVGEVGVEDAHGIKAAQVVVRLYPLRRPAATEDLFWSS